MKLNFIIREEGEAYSEWPEYRIETSDGVAVAEVFGANNKKLGVQMAAAPELLEIAKAYRNLLRTAAHTDGEVATFHHIESVLAKAEGEET